MTRVTAIHRRQPSVVLNSPPVTAESGHRAALLVLERCPLRGQRWGHGFCTNSASPDLPRVSKLIRSADTVSSADSGRGPVQILGRAKSKKSHENRPLPPGSFPGLLPAFCGRTGAPGGPGVIYTLLCCGVLSHSVVSDSATPWTLAHQAPLQAGLLEWVAIN